RGGLRAASRTFGTTFHHRGVNARLTPRGWLRGHASDRSIYRGGSVDGIGEEFQGRLEHRVDRRGGVRAAGAGDVPGGGGRARGASGVLPRPEPWGLPPVPDR